jgi:hypothetical protein
MKRLYNSAGTVAKQAKSNVLNRKGGTRVGVIMLVTMGVQWYTTGEAPNAYAVEVAIGFILT